MSKTESTLPLLFLLGLLLSTAAWQVADQQEAISQIPSLWRFSEGDAIIIGPTGGGKLGYWHDRTGDCRRLARSGNEYAAGPRWGLEQPVQVRIAFTADGRRLTWRESDRSERTASRLAIRQVIIRFQSRGMKLLGRLLLPEGSGPFPLVVFHPGSERSGAIGVRWDPYLFPAEGVACFLYDKRGTGGSAGEFTMNFTQLAADMQAAIEAVRGHPDIDPDRIGAAGFSQGGWIAPLAAAELPVVKFIIIGYGLAVSPAEEDREQTLAALRRAGFTGNELERARELIEAAQAVVKKDLQSGWKQFSVLKQKNRNADWLEALDPNAVTHSLVKYPRWAIQTIGKKRFPPDLLWDYDPLPVLERLQIPQLWLLAGDDREAPIEATRTILEGYRRRGKPVTVTVFPGADHGMAIYREEDGRRNFKGYVPGYGRTMVDWIKERMRE